MELGPILRAMSRNKARFGLIVAQIALTLGIVANCVTLIQDARRKMSYPKAFDEDNLVMVGLPMQDARHSEDPRRRSLWNRDVLQRLRGIASVRAVASTSFFPFGGWTGGWIKAAGSGAPLTISAVYAADEQLPDALGLQLDEGRWFSREEVERLEEWTITESEKHRERDAEGKVRSPITYECVISRALGRHLLGEGPIAGKMLEDRDGDFCRIVGVIGTYFSPIGNGALAEHVMFYPGYGHHRRFGAAYVARAEPGQAATVAQSIPRELSKALALNEYSVRLVSEARDVTFGSQQMTVTLMGLLIGILLFVASLGISGLTSFSVTARTRQIGTRRALGATTADIVRHFLTEAGLLTAMGLVSGVGVAVGLNIVLLKVYTDAKLSPAIVASSALVLGIVGIGAALPPALRASRTSPAIATRNV